MTRHYEFSAIIQKNPDMDAAYVEFPWDVRREFGKGRVAVRATFDGCPYDEQLVRMKTDGHIIGIRKDIRPLISKEPGDEIVVTIRERAIRKNPRDPKSRSNTQQAWA